MRHYSSLCRIKSCRLFNLRRPIYQPVFGWHITKPEGGKFTQMQRVSETTQVRKTQFLCLWKSFLGRKVNKAISNIMRIIKRPWLSRLSYLYGQILISQFLWGIKRNSQSKIGLSGCWRPTKSESISFGQLTISAISYNHRITLYFKMAWHVMVKLWFRRN